MRRYADLIVSYWELSEQSRGLVEEVNRYWGLRVERLHRWIALTGDGNPIGKVLLPLAAPPRWQRSTG